MDLDDYSLDLKRLKFYHLKDRGGKVKIKDLGTPHKTGQSFQAFLKGLPNILAGDDLKDLISRVCKAYQGGKEVILGMGAHGIKVGLSPIIIDLMQRGIITSLALNGACAIHDLEMAIIGATSEMVEDVIVDGRFGMAKETGDMLNSAVNKGWVDNIGMGMAIGRYIVEADMPYIGVSILAQAYKLRIPCTVHVAVGTDTVHFHPSCRGEAIGKTSLRDFLRFASVVSRLEGGVYINMGSAVILPEVFLKALSLVRNLGHKIKNITTANIDFRDQYRPRTNVVERPTIKGGRGINLIGHLEIMVPLVAAGVIEKLGLKD